jgi:hypothetical protein
MPSSAAACQVALQTRSYESLQLIYSFSLIFLLNRFVYFQLLREFVEIWNPLETSVLRFQPLNGTAARMWRNHSIELSRLVSLIGSRLARFVMWMWVLLVRNRSAWRHPRTETVCRPLLWLDLARLPACKFYSYFSEVIPVYKFDFGLKMRVDWIFCLQTKCFMDPINKKGANSMGSNTTFENCLSYPINQHLQNKKNQEQW